MNFLKNNVIEFDKSKEKQIMDSIRSFPRMRLKASVKNFDSDNNMEDDKPIQAGG